LGTQQGAKTKPQQEIRGERFDGLNQSKRSQRAQPDRMEASNSRADSTVSALQIMLVADLPLS
jgi:hypothetical protein